MEQVYCQSCGMPMAEEKDCGSNKDAGKNEDYCVYCYKDGEFTQEMTMDEMIALCAEHMGEYEGKVTKEEAIIEMKEYFPSLKRWKS